MATYYVELGGGNIAPTTGLTGGGNIAPTITLIGGDIYAGGSGGGGGNMQTKSVSYTPTESAISASVTPDPGYDGMDQVNVSVGAISSTYVGSGVARNDSTDLTASGATVTAPAGYYENAASKAIPNASSPYFDSASIDSSGNLSVDIEIDNGGYIPDGTYGATMSSAVPVQAAQTIYPSTSDQSIASGKYLTGAQTIKGVTYSGLDASNIKKDVVVKIGDSADDDRIVSVTGTYEGGGGGDLPEGYEAYDYIALDLADGTSYQNNNYAIIAPIAMSSDYTFETKIMYNSATNTSAQPILGTRTSSSGTKEFALFYTPSSGRCGYWVNGTDSTNAGNWFVADAVNSVEFLPVGKDETYPTKVAIKVNGTSHNSGSSSTGVTYSNWIGFFKYAVSATATVGNATYYGLKIGETKIKDGNGVLLHDLVPCLLGGMYAGFYDKIAEAFYTNSSQITRFITGNWTNPSPQEVLDIVFGD